MDRSPTRLVTLHRLSGLASLDAARDAISLDPDAMSDRDVDTQQRRVTVADCDGFWFTATVRDASPAWLKDAEITVGQVPEVVESSGGGVLIVNVDADFYAISFGQGFRWIRDDLRDRRFGLRVAVRCLDPESLHAVVRRRPGQGRTESTHVAGGAPVTWVRPRDLSEIVRQIGGHSLPLPLTYQPPGDRSARLHGSSGLRVRLGLRGVDLVADIRAIRAVHDRPPLDELAFVDDVAPVEDDDTLTVLDRRFDELIGRDTAPDALVLAVPDVAVDKLDRIHSYRVRLGRRGRGRPLTDLELADLAGADAHDLREGWVAALAEDGVQVVRTAAIRWVEASIGIGDRTFTLLDGVWHEFGHDYAERVHADVRRVFRESRSLALPSWRPGEEEKDYNRRVQEEVAGYVCLDRHLIRDRGLHNGRGLEVCDLLGPDDELIHVKRAKGSAALSHLFAQGLVSYFSHQGLPETRAGFRDLVRDVGGRTLAPDWSPRRVVFAVLLETGRELTPDSLFPFSRASLAQTAAELTDRKVAVDVVGLRCEVASRAA